MNEALGILRSLKAGNSTPTITPPNTGHSSTMPSAMDQTQEAQAESMDTVDIEAILVGSHAGPPPAPTTAVAIPPGMHYMFAMPIPVGDHVDEATVERVRMNKFVEFNHLLKNGKGEEHDLVVSDNKVKTKSRDLPALTFYEWLMAWNTFLAINTRLSQDPHLASKMCQHFEQVFELHSQKDDWSGYDRRFRKAVEKGRAEWGDIHYKLVMDARASPATPGKSKKTPSAQSSGDTGFAVPVGFCFRYHKHNSCRQDCGYSHLCFSARCGRHHSFLNCPTQAQPFIQAPPVGRTTQSFRALPHFGQPSQRNNSFQRKQGRFGGKRF